LGVVLREEDKVSHFLYLNSHDQVLFFTNKGKVFKLPAYEIPLSERQSLGRGILNFLELEPQEFITSILNFGKEKKEYFLMVTAKGIIKKTKSEDFEIVRRSGLRAIKLQENDNLVFVGALNKNDEVLLANNKGNVIRFKEKDLREMGRNAMGVLGMRLKEDEKIVGAEILEKKDQRKIFLLTVSENGFAKMTDIGKFRLQKRGGKGIIGMKITRKTGDLAKTFLISEEEEFVIISTKGQTIRTSIKSIPKLTRASQGVRVIKLKGNDKVASGIAF